MAVSTRPLNSLPRRLPHYKPPRKPIRNSRERGFWFHVPTCKTENHLYKLHTYYWWKKSILHQLSLVVFFPHYFQGFMHPSPCRISSISSRTIKFGLYFAICFRFALLRHFWQTRDTLVRSFGGETRTGWWGHLAPPSECQSFQYFRVNIVDSSLIVEVSFTELEQWMYNCTYNCIKQIWVIICVCVYAYARKY